MNKQALLEETYRSAFEDELEKIAKESIWDPDLKKERKKVQSIAQYYPATGMLGGAFAGSTAGAIASIKKLKGRPLASGLLTGALGLGGIIGGVAGAAKLQTKKRDKFVAGMSNEKYKRLYAKNRMYGAGDKEMREFSDAFNKSVAEGKGGLGLKNAKHETMRKEIMGY